MKHDGITMKVGSDRVLFPDKVNILVRGGRPGLDAVCLAHTQLRNVESVVGQVLPELYAQDQSQWKWIRHQITGVKKYVPPHLPSPCSQQKVVG